MFTPRHHHRTGPAAIAAAIAVVSPALGGSACLSNELTKLTASDAAAGDEYGIGVANSDGFAVVGSWRAVVDGMSQHGAAYVYRYDGAMWTPFTKLTDNDGSSFDRFGRSVTIDGDTIAVGSHFDDMPLSKSGSVVVFELQGGVWSQVAKLIPSDAALNDEFGWSVALSGDTLVVGAHYDGDGAAFGSAYVFERNAGGPGNWGQVAKLTASDAWQGDQFGESVAVSGTRIVVGAHLDDDAMGAVYVFDRPTDGWEDMTETVKLTASDAALGDEFGRSVGVSGNTVIVGAFRNDDNGSASGSVYCFDFNGGWNENKINAPDASNGDYFGWSVAVDGELAVIGAYLDDDMGTSSGSGYVYRNVGGTWTYQGKFNASDGAGNDNFGIAVSVADDTAIIGSFHDGDAGTNSGAAYAFGGLSDCNDNGMIDGCDIANGTSFDDDGDGIPDECQTPTCSADLDGNGTVDTVDFLDLLASWGDCGAECPADLDGDGSVGVTDFLELLSTWGPCP